MLLKRMAMYMQLMTFTTCSGNNKANQNLILAFTLTEIS